MPRWTIHAGLVAVVSVACLLAGYRAGAQEVEPKGTPNSLQPGQVMKVGDTIITSEQLLARIWDAEVMIEEGKRELPKELTYLRDTALLELEAKRLGGLYFVEAERIAEKDAQIKVLKDGLKERTRGMLTYEEWLKQQGMTVEQFETYVYERTPVILLKRILVNYFEWTEESIDSSHILVKTRERANDLHKRLKGVKAEDLNTTFEDLAVTHSEDPGSSVTRGRLPRVYRHDGSFVKEAGDALWELKDGEFSGPVQTDYGYHIFLRRKTYQPRKESLTALLPELKKAATRPNEEDYFNRWVRWVFNTQKYKVERRLPGYDCKPDKKIGEK